VPEMLVIVAVASVVKLAMCLVFLLVAYTRGVRKDLLAAAKALYKIRTLGVVPALVRVIEASKSDRDMP
jgi:uncharacterized membrane protein